MGMPRVQRATVAMGARAWAWVRQGAWDCGIARESGCLGLPERNDSPRVMRGSGEKRLATLH